MAETFGCRPSEWFEELHDDPLARLQFDSFVFSAGSTAEFRARKTQAARMKRTGGR